MPSTPLAMRRSRSACAAITGSQLPARHLRAAPRPGRLAAAVRAVSEDAPEIAAAEAPSTSAIVVEAPSRPEEPTMTAGELKAALLDSFYGTERGLSARSEVRAEINELITQLEAANPTPSPTEMNQMLDGTWRLVYTSNSELIALLALSRLPFTTVGDITQRIDTAAGTVENRVALAAPLSRTALSATASFEVRSPKRLQIKFEQGRVQTPELLADIQLPASLMVMGQTVDLGPLKAALDPVKSNIEGLIASVGSLVRQAPDLQFPIQSDGAQTWLLTTYLDADTRITRGDGGSVFILVKDDPPAAY